MKLLQSSLQSRGTVLLKDLAVQLDGIGTVPLSTLTTSSFSINIGELQDQEKLQVYDSFIAKNCKSVDVGNYVSYSEDGTKVRTPRTLTLTVYHYLLCCRNCTVKWWLVYRPVLATSIALCVHWNFFLSVMSTTAHS